MKILYINGSFSNDSGSGVIAKNTFELFNHKEGFEVEYFTTKEFCENINYKFYKYFPCRMNTTLKYLTNIWTYYYNWKARGGIEKILKDFKPDIVHVHSLRFSSMTYSCLAPFIKRNIPIIMTIHDAYLICPMMTLKNSYNETCLKCKGLNKFYCFTNKCASNFEQSFRIALLAFINRLTNYDKYVFRFITPSLALKMLLVENCKYTTDENTIVINNYLSKDEFEYIKPNCLNNGYFLYIGRLSQEKGVHYLLEAMKDLPIEIKLKIAGTGPDENKLKKYVEENNLSNVEFLGFKNREEIKELYQNCISTILPCNWFEIFGMTNIESFINGKPVIASNIGGIPEIVEDNINGLLFEPGNVEQLKECILKYWNNLDLVIEHGKNGYKKAITQYTEEKYYCELMKVNEEVLNNA